MSQIAELKSFASTIEGKILFNYDLKKTNWFNIGGKTKVYFKPNSLNELSSFLKKFGKKEKLFVLGAGSNVLINDGIYNGVIIKLGKRFSNISLLSENTIIAGSAASDKELSKFALANNISGLEFLSCIPGTVGGGIRMNSGCFESEFKDVLISVQAIDKSGTILTIPVSKIKFEYRNTDLNEDLIFLSATFKGITKKKEEIETQMEFLRTKKDKAQPTKVKTGGSTFKNPKNQTSQKVWELIKKSVPLNTKFGDAEISNKHCNFFVNSNNATFEDMNKLVEFVKKNVELKTGIKLETEIIIVS